MSLSFKSQIAPKGLEFKASEMIISDKYRVGDENG